MVFTVIRPNGHTEKRRHIPYKVKHNGQVWEAFHAETGRICARSWTSEARLREMMSTTTEEA